jgi:hypothetical protein
VDFWICLGSAGTSALSRCQLNVSQFASEDMKI